MLEKILDLIRAVSWKPSSKLEAVFYLTHGALLCSGFTGVVEQSNGIPGFEPSLREVPARMFLPPTWSKSQSQLSSNNIVSFLYKFSSKPGKLFALKVQLLENDTVNIEIGQRTKDEEKQSFQISLNDLFASRLADADADANDGGTVFGEFSIENFELLDAPLLTGMQNLLPDVDFLSLRSKSFNTPANQTETITVTTTTQHNVTSSSTPKTNNGPPPSSFSASHSSSAKNTSSPATLAGFAAPVRKSTPLVGFAPAASAPTPFSTNTNLSQNQATAGFAAVPRSNYSSNNSDINVPPTGSSGRLGPYNQHSSPYNVGRSDLDPFSNVAFPGGIGGGLMGDRGSSTGNLVGPNHPMFFDGPNNANNLNNNDGNRFFPANPFVPPGMHLPVPRYDPTGPVFTRNENMILGNIHPGNVNTTVHPRYEGEPNNDLEPIPGFEFNGEVPINMTHDNDNLPVPPNDQSNPSGRNVGIPAPGRGGGPRTNINNNGNNTNR